MGNKKPPLVTVLVPAFNAEKFIENSINSIICQTYKELEILVIDDGSTDKTNIILKKFQKKEKRILLIENKINKGLLYSLNFGLNISKGKYLIRMDADDISFPKRIEKQVSFLEKNRKIAICSSARLVKRGNAFKIYNSRPRSNAFIKAFLMFENPIAHPTVAINLDLLKKYNLKYESFYAEDLSLWLRASKTLLFYNLKEPLLIYNEHELQISQTKNTKNKKYTDQLIKDHRKSIKSTQKILYFILYLYTKMLIKIDRMFNIDSYED